MKFTEVTKENIHLIKHRLYCFIERMQCIGMTSYYPESKMWNSIIPDKDIVTQSMQSFLTNDDYLLEIDREMRKTPFIRINYQYGNNGFLVEPGDKICIKTNHIYIKSTHPTDKYRKCLEVWEKGDFNKGKQQSYENKMYSDMYWDDMANDF